ncbi:MAG: site-2 protease family protein [Candidatus Heimdallarchaeota archaeon]|nr:site-2 protease family protein [Candidatus Heimdallarchaeota archaeon]
MAVLEAVFIIAILWITVIFLSTRYNFEKRGILIAPLILLWRTDRFKSFFKIFTRGRGTRIWKKVGNLSVIISLFLFLFVPSILLLNLILGVLGDPAPIFTSNPIELITLETFILISIPLIISIFLHELAHAVMATNEDIEIEKTGLMIIVIFLLTFVKVSEEKLKKLTKLQNLRITTSGLFVNFVLLLFFLSLLFASNSIVDSMYQDSSGVLVTAVEPAGPVAIANVQRGTIITGVKVLDSTNQLGSISIQNSADLLAVLRNIPVGQIMILETNYGEYSVYGVFAPFDTFKYPSSYLAMSFVDYRQPKYDFLSPFLPYLFVAEILWFININIVLGVYNILPLPLSDGMRILETLIAKFSDVTKTRIEKIAYGVSAVLLTGNVLLTIF